MSDITFKEPTPDLWKDLEKLFGAKGACGGCWCQWWRIPKGGKLWEETKGAKAKKRMKKLITSGELTGLLAYDGSRPVGWCSFGPRTSFPRTERMKAYSRDDIEKVWSVNCFFIDKDYRHQGLAWAMLEAALKCMKKRKVEIVEGYPTPLTKDGKKLPAAFAYTGPLKIFEDSGFEIIQRVSYSRPLVRRRL
ncbi:MAG: GNAT family N-acetyltransferase [FCB group bacterium]|nr:GNAT family N-acetyltransferase [FCB group bacterium]